MYRIVKDAVGCRIRGDLDLVQDCFKKADDGALKDLIGRHRCMELKKGTKVSLLDDTYNWGWYRVRPMGTADVLSSTAMRFRWGSLIGYGISCTSLAGEPLEILLSGPNL